MSAATWNGISGVVCENTLSNMQVECCYTLNIKVLKARIWYSFSWLTPLAITELFLDFIKNPPPSELLLIYGFVISDKIPVMYPVV